MYTHKLAIILWCVVLHRPHLLFLDAEAITHMDPWPARSPDMNPIEHCWDELGRAVRQRTQPGDTLADLHRYLTEEWNNIPQARIQTVVHSMGKHPQPHCSIIQPSAYKPPACKPAEESDAGLSHIYLKGGPVPPGTQGLSNLPKYQPGLGETTY